MDKFWLKSYPKGVPADIDLSEYRSLIQLLEESLKKYAARPAFICMDKTITYKEVDTLSTQVAAWLQSTGLEKGARVAVMLPNILPNPVATIGAIRGGYTVVNINPLYTARELEHQLIDSGAEVIFILDNFASILEKIINNTAIKHVVVVSMGDLLGALKGAIVNFVVRYVKHMIPLYTLHSALKFSKVMDAGSKLKLTPPDVTMEDIAFLQYTGGTTGISKGAMLTHRNIVANVLQSAAWFSPIVAKSDDDEGSTPHQVTVLGALPLYHIYGLTVCELFSLHGGAVSVLVPNPRDIAGFIREVTKYTFDIFPAVNTLYNALLNHPDFWRLAFSRLKSFQAGGMAVQKSVADRWFEASGKRICEGYGLSETSPIVSSNPIDGSGVQGTIGLPFPSTEIKILNEDGVEVPLGQHGEIAIHGPQVMLGYWKKLSETAKVMTADGFFKSGDIGFMDQSGYITIVDRKKDMINVSGFNVYPNEVEDVVAMLPGVLECACIGVPDEHSGEAVKLFVVKKDPKLTEEDIVEHCKKELTGYKRPKYIEFRDELPKTNVGKILRRQLRDSEGR